MMRLKCQCFFSWKLPHIFLHSTHFLQPNYLSHLPFLLFQLSPFLYVFLCTWRTKHPTKHKPSSCVQHLLQSEHYGNFFFSLIFSWIAAALRSVMHLLPRTISWTETNSRNIFMIQSTILMTFLPRGREGEFSVFLLPALSTLGSTIQSKLNKVIRSVWGGFPRAEPFRIFCSFLNAEMLSNIACFLQTILCNAHLICIYNTALQQVMIIEIEPGDTSTPISLSHFNFSLIFQEPKNLFFLKIFFFSIATSNQWNFSRPWRDCIWAQLSALSLSKWVPCGSKWPSSLHHTVHKVISVQDMTKSSIFNSQCL